MRGDSKREPNVHARRISLDGRIQEPLHFRKGDDLVEFSFDLLALHTQDGTVEIDVFAAGQLWMEIRSRLRAGSRRDRGAESLPSGGET